MMGEPITLLSRRPPEIGGAEYICELCRFTIITMVREDHFPSCRTCRGMCAISRQFVGER